MLVYTNHQKRSENSAAYSTENADIKMNPSAHRMPLHAKSLVSGRFYSEIPTATNKQRNTSGSADANFEHVIVDSMLRQNSRTKLEKHRKTKNKVSSTSSFLASISACIGVGKFGTAILNDDKEETRFENRSKNFNFDDSVVRMRYCSNDKKETEDPMVQFSNAGKQSLGRSRTYKTVDTSVEESMLQNWKENMVTVESIGRGSSIPLEEEPQTMYDGFSIARRLLFKENEENVNLEKNSGCSNVICTNSKKICSNQNDTSSKGTNHDGISFLQWYSNPSSCNSDRSSVGASLTAPPQSLYAASYGDDDDIITNSAGINPKEGSIVSYEVNDENAQSPSSTIYATSSSSFTDNKGRDREIQYWRKRLHYATKHYGMSHSSTADAYFNLGRAQLNSKHNEVCNDSFLLHVKDPRDVAAWQKHQYDSAIENLTAAHGIWECKHGPEHLAVGRALDSLALAVVRRANHNRSTTTSGSSHSRTSQRFVAEDLNYAKRLLEEAFAIRVHHLGVWHVDTIETYNKLASVLLHLGLFKEASRSYREVFLVRRAIFGNRHPSIAITAHSLANCHYRMRAFQESLRWYRISLDVYEMMGLSYRHPAVTKLLKDQSRLEEFYDA